LALPAALFCTVALRWIRIVPLSPMLMAGRSVVLITALVCTSTVPPGVAS
jgi:hypothetical protein